jgi:hypothetical protein
MVSYADEVEHPHVEPEADRKNRRTDPSLMGFCLPPPAFPAWVNHDLEK